MHYTFYEAALFFIIYAFLGWCAEVAYAAFAKGEFVNRGFLNGPLCPIYGFGVVIVISALRPLKDNIFLLFAGSVVLTSALELVTGFVLERVFHEKWWDYSDVPFNFHGYICAGCSILWGLACVFVVDLIHPMIEGAMRLLPKTAGIVLLSVIGAVLLADIILTVKAILKIKSRVKTSVELEAQIRRLSDGIGEKISDGVITVMKKRPEMEEALDELQQKYKALAEKRTERRIFTAYPNLKKLRSPGLADRTKKLIASVKEELEKAKNKKEM